MKLYILPDTKMLAPMTGAPQMEICARCHSRRVPISEDYVHGKPLLDTHRLSLLDERLYHADGQIKDEVYVYGSFIQSRMHREGIVCADCHDPHSMRTYRQGNALCVRCHDADELDTKEHHFHEPGTEGSYCVDCHAPETTYMVVDPRRDHSFRIPRPDLSDRLGTPNACNGCHDDQTNEWSAKYVREWYGKDRRQEWHYGEAIHAGREGAPGAAAELAKLARDESQPGISRATALMLLARFRGPAARAVMPKALKDDDPIVRAAAVRSLADWPASDAADLALPRLSDPVRLVRVEAARLLATVSPGRLSKEQQERLREGVVEYIRSETVNSDRGASHANLGIFHTRRRDLAAAEAAYRTAIAVEPAEMRPYVNLADLYRETGRDDLGQEVLERALERAPDDAALHHAMGLLLVRRDRRNDALVSFQRAATLLPGNARFVYVYGVALNDAGLSERAIEVLRDGLARHDNDPGILQALATMYRDAGRIPEAIVIASKLTKVSPEDAGAKALLQQLRAAHRK